MDFYAFLSRFSYLKSYKSKLMLVAFAGTHIPLLTLLFYLLSSTKVGSDAKLMVLLVALIATLIGTIATLFALHQLLRPIGATALAIKNYWNKQQLPSLPTHYTDDAGILMANTMQVIRKLDNFIHYIEDYDNLTGLANRKLFRQHLDNKIENIIVQEQTIATRNRLERKTSICSASLLVLVIDIDGFKGLNAVKGNELSDQILKEIARRLSRYVDCATDVARLGNDEFVVLLSQPIRHDSIAGLSQPAPDHHHAFEHSPFDHSPFGRAHNRAQAILRLLSEPYDTIERDLHLTVSLGIATYPTDGETPDALIANAYTALQQAKQRGHNSYQFYAAQMSKTLQRRLRLANDLRYALSNQQLVLHYQPRIDWRDRRMVGAECLVRWQHPELGMISPAEFIPIAEETGLIVPIGEWILRTACQQRKQWQQQGLAPFTIAVNLSVRQIEQPDLID